VRARADQDREIRRGDLLQIKLDHHVLGNLPAFEGSILQAGNPAFEPCYKGFAAAKTAELQPGAGHSAGAGNEDDQ
jgi:hypothetical protein